MAKDLYKQDQGWKEFIEEPVYANDQAPWHDDPAFSLIVEFPGLRASVGGRIAEALTQTINLVRALTQVDLLEVVQTSKPAQGLCLGFGTNALEPYDLLRVFALDRVHAYEWIGEHVIEAAQILAALRTQEVLRTQEASRAQASLLPTQIRLHHGTINNLSAITASSIQVIYVANIFNYEIPMTPETFTGALGEMLRVLVKGGLVLSRGSSGVLEEKLAQYGQMLMQTPLVSVFQKE
jgi:hypothetical protein